MQELGNAINDSLSESDRIAEAIGEIKRAGYDVFLVLEATIGFNRRDEDEAEDEAGSGTLGGLTKPGVWGGRKIQCITLGNPCLRALKNGIDDGKHCVAW